MIFVTGAAAAAAADDDAADTRSEHQLSAS